MFMFSGRQTLTPVTCIMCIGYIPVTTTAHTGEAHIDTIIVNERAAAALVLVGPAVTRVRSCKMLFDYNFK